MRAYRWRAAIKLSRLRYTPGNNCVSGTLADASELIEVVVGEVTGVPHSAAQYAPEDVPVLEAGDNRAHCRSLDASDHHAREGTCSLETAGVVVGVERDDAAYSLAEVDGRRQRERRTQGLSRQREVGEVEFIDDPDDRGAQRRFLVAGAGDDVRPAHAGKVDCVDRERVADLRDDPLEVVELRTHGVHQDQGRAASDAQVADARATAQRDVTNLPALAPRLGVAASCLVLVSRSAGFSEFV
jgi:hypothetical protein